MTQLPLSTKTAAANIFLDPSATCKYFLPSFWGFSFVFGRGVSFFVCGIQHSSVNGYSATSCNFGVIAGKDERESAWLQPEGGETHFLQESRSWECVGKKGVWGRRWGDWTSVLTICEYFCLI